MIQLMPYLRNFVSAILVKLTECIFLYFLWAVMSDVSCKTIKTQRFEDLSFPAHTLILKENVTCGNYTPGKFVAPTYTCADLRVNGHRLAYGYYSGWETSGVHEFAQLCLMMLKSINVEKLGFKAAYVPKSTCAYINETRKLLKKVSGSEFKWTDFKPGWGWTETIQCMTDVANIR
ncbi:unnamed protein product [Candidula unifasciata]|uniref:Uncharacterized protein n=1 Tax=Candidula unifasciata TaxID=100452 RepID=A0A8S3YVX0_9EUPU|nr:unnamed protein product [Candidula unifasciata]